MTLPVEVKFEVVNRHGAIYYFNNEGDELPPHSHPLIHDSLIIAGSFQVLGENGCKLNVVNAPHKVKINKGAVHGFKALTKNSILMSIFEV